jgi:hypothetical protein
MASRATTWFGLIATERPLAASVNHASCMIDPREAPTMAASTVSGEPRIS